MFPAVFKTMFSGFNCPEKSKHRKRELNNLSEKKLEKHCIVIREIMQSLPFIGSRVDRNQTRYLTDDPSC